MILADTSIWIDYLRGKELVAPHDLDMQQRLSQGQIVMHPFIVAEIALGSLRNRQARIADMESLLEVKVAHLSEVRHMIESHALYSRGIGLTDVHLIASCLITPGTQLWTRDAAMQSVARALGIAVNRP